MNRESARKALDDALEERLKHMFQILADSFLGSTNAIATAKQNFNHGVGCSLEALAYADSVIDENFKDNT
jgi:hypothetical protein